MHECPTCGELCYCDMEDCESEEPIDDCTHDCQQEPDYDLYDEEEQP